MAALQHKRTTVKNNNEHGHDNDDHDDTPNNNPIYKGTGILNDNDSNI